LVVRNRQYGRAADLQHELEAVFEKEDNYPRNGSAVIPALARYRCFDKVVRVDLHAQSWVEVKALNMLLEAR
jgi:hypothetical protein